MPELPEIVKRTVWRRDGFRCQQCGVAVATSDGLGAKPQTHHRNPRGGDSLENLITLCWTCHATKDSPGHRSLLLNATDDELTSNIKSCFWQLSTDLLIYAQGLSAFDLPVNQVLEKIQYLRSWLDSVEQMTRQAITINPELANNEADAPTRRPEILEEIHRGFDIAYWSSFRQIMLDQDLNG